ncbi:esterase [Kribbella antibiotica]|uniref:Esterase n=1 Tax=Kribbella antibiotica TaxID=190195 RepID=A0A4R4ZJJ9_9ACTN|nr:alpha/beta hydrolase-fold protein [Kribbella antibiotica]TDD57739.1 esterase [Kribbella antibiotica]
METITETFSYGGGRRVTAFIPSEPAEAIIYAGDGQLISQWGAFLNESPGVPPTMLVAADRVDDEMDRLHEYSPVFDAERFAAHEKFFVDDIRAHFGITLPASRTAILGVSASGELALALGLRHPDVYGAILCASPGAGYRPPGDMQAVLPRAYFTAGTKEPFFQENAVRWADALKDAGADVVITERAGDHGDPFWREELPLMAAWAFS